MDFHRNKTLWSRRCCELNLGVVLYDPLSINLPVLYNALFHESRYVIYEDIIGDIFAALWCSLEPPWQGGLTSDNNLHFWEQNKKSHFTLYKSCLLHGLVYMMKPILNLHTSSKL